MAPSSEKKKKLDLLAGDGGEDCVGDDVDLSNIQVDAAYARRFEHNKRREALHRYEELKKQGRVASSDSDESSDSDDSSGDEVAVDGALASIRTDLRLFDAIARIRRNDPGILEQDAKIYSDSDSDSGDHSADDSGEAEPKRTKKERPLYLKDVNARHLLEEGPEFGEKSDKFDRKLYNEDQREALKAFLDAEKSAFGNGDDDGDVFRVKEKATKDDGDGEEAHQTEELLGEIFGKDEELDENEKFLKDFFLNRPYLEAEKKKDFSFDDIRGVSEDEDELDKQDEYEATYNFRHEESGAADRVVGHSRVVEGSVRKKESSRKKQRKSKEERMTQARHELEEEVKHLKNLKKKEINEKLEKIRMVAGIGEDEGCKLGVDDLEEDFNPDEYDKKMQEMFDDGYYDAEDADPGFGSDEEGDLVKPDFDKEDELLGLPKDWDLGESSGKAADTNGEEELGNEKDEKKRKRKISLKDKVELEKEMEEYYKLDFEDNIGDLKTRFKYKPVKANRFGLSTEDILMADDKDLNQYVSLKKIAPYRENEWKVTHHKKLSKGLILGGEKSDGKKGKAGKKSRLQEGPSSSEPEKQERNEQVESNGKTKKSTRSTRRKRRNAELKLSRSRLMAYGKISSKPQKKN